MQLKYVKKVRAKGKAYYYFDTGKTVDGKKVFTRLPDPKSLEFGGAYAALRGHRNRGHRTELTRIPKLIELYEKSKSYTDLSPASKKLYDTYLRRLERMLPTAPVAEITRTDMQLLFDSMGETPGAANAFLKTSGALFSWAAKRGYMPGNPCEGIEKVEGGEHLPWPDNLVDAGRVAEDHSVRLLVLLLLYTGQRLGDVLAMRWSDVSGLHIKVKQSKTQKPLVIRMHKELRAEIEVTPKLGLTIVADAEGRPIKDPAARYKLQKFAKKFGYEVVPHGLRKNAVIALLECGCTIAETAAISGQTLRMVEYYARQRDQQRLGDAAILRWENAT